MKVKNYVFHMDIAYIGAWERIIAVPTCVRDLHEKSFCAHAPHGAQPAFLVLCQYLYHISRKKSFFKKNQFFYCDANDDCVTHSMTLWIVPMIVWNQKMILLFLHLCCVARKTKTRERRAFLYWLVLLFLFGENYPHFEWGIYDNFVIWNKLRLWRNSSMNGSIHLVLFN